ncbi:MAG: FAD-dependent oxidoreductase [Xanthomonadaceae bacterium]|nr:FAD-dependent oxidoreductase [Xanthomonadaceae bacterium]
MSRRTYRLAPTKLEEFVPCQRGCPVFTDAGRYVQLIAEGKFLEAYLIARNSNPLVEICGQVCAAPCEDFCRRGHIDTSITIRALKNFLVDQYSDQLYDPPDFLAAFDQTDESLSANLMADHLSQLPRQEKSGKRVAVVGAGPAGMGCAHDLLLLGHEVDVFEASCQFGGALKISIPMYRLGRDYIERLAANLLAMGGTIAYNRPITKDWGVSHLLAEYDAVFLGVGATTGRKMNIPGGDAEGVITSLEFLEKVNLGQPVDLGDKVVVIGGGRVALDAVRTSRRMFTERDYSGALDTVRSTVRMGSKHTDIAICYRRSFTEMPSYKTLQGQEELEETIKEGIPIFENLWPVRVETENGRVKAMVFEEKRSADEQGREVLKEANTIIAAVGQDPDLSFLLPEDGIEVARWGTIAYDEETMATSREGVYTGGDAALGPATLIEAAATGKKAAWHMDDYLRKEKKHFSYHVYVNELPAETYVESVDYNEIGREAAPTKDVEKRGNFELVEGVYPEEEARKQARRCLSCHIKTVYQPSLCILCGRCVDHCPNDCLRFVFVDQLEGNDLPAKTALIKNDDQCIRCGLCARRCPTRAMQMERVYFKSQVS